MCKVILFVFLISSFSFANWDPRCDLDGNGEIGVGDITTLAFHWLETNVIADYDIDQDGTVGFGDFAEMAPHWLATAPPPDWVPDITWVFIDDHGVSGHEGFLGYMSKYETTNAQYCKFLNDALATGDITIENNYVKGANGTNFGIDYVWSYYRLDGPGDTGYMVTDGGKSRISLADGVFTLEAGFENHPVTYVSWYGAAAFCNYYGWQLPTEWQWISVADYDGSYAYPTGASINNDIANYDGSTHPDGTTAVGDFGLFGYGIADMAGNAAEWTDTFIDPGYYYPMMGGSWFSGDHLCDLSVVPKGISYNMNHAVGFRVCNTQTIVPTVIGATQAAAETEISQAGLTPGTVFETFSDTFAAGVVITQTPSSGQPAALGTAVDIVVSLGEAPTPQPDITWVGIADAGVQGHEGFWGDMGKYETTNAQYCQFLNAALLSGDITVELTPGGNSVKGDDGINAGIDFVDTQYYLLGMQGKTTEDGAVNGGASKISYIGGVFAVVNGFGNHPVTYVTWHGAAAFCNYYGWYLPTRWQWLAVADYDGTYIYATGLTGNNILANFYYSDHPHGTTAVGDFGLYGYGMADMSGNVWEWTTSLYTGEGMPGVNRYVCGGSWDYGASICSLASEWYLGQHQGKYNMGFRACR